METKCVIVIDETLPTGLIANTAAILGTTLGKEAPELVGENITDASGFKHLGIVEIPLPILKADKTHLHELREKSASEKFSEVTVAAFTDTAQGCKTYQEYIGKLQRADSSDYHYLGLGFYGEKKKINRLTGDLPLLR